MAGPASPGSEGPTFEPPSLPPGWIAQWDGNSKKYYYVQLSTGVSQWEVPTDAAPVGGTPAAGSDHPYGVPGQVDQLITHPDGTQTVKRADGSMEPVMPQGSRGVGEGQAGDRGLGKVLVNALSGGHGSSGGSHGNGGLGGVAGQLIGQFTHSNNHNNSHNNSSGSHGSSGGAGKLVGALASNLFSKPSTTQAPQNYHGAQQAHTSNTGGIAGSMMGGVAGLFGGGKHASHQNYGYSNAGHNAGYSGSAPPTSYQPGSVPPNSYQTPPSGHYQGAQVPTNTPPYHASGGPTYASGGQVPTPPYTSPPNSQQAHTSNFPTPQGQMAHAPGFPPPPAPGQQGGYGQQGAYGQPTASQPYGTSTPHTTHYGGGHPPDYGQPQYAAHASYSPQYGNTPHQAQQPHNSPYPHSQPTYTSQQPQSYGQHHY